MFCTLQMGGKAPAGQAHVQVPAPPRSPSPGSEPSYAKPYKSRNLSQSSSANSSLQVWQIMLNHIALRKTKIVYNFGLSECNMVTVKMLKIGTLKIIIVMVLKIE